MKKFQYQSIAKPIIPSIVAEIITVDKWWMQTSEPLRESLLKKSLYALLATSIFFTELITPVKAGNLPDWYQKTSEPVRVKESRTYITQGDFKWIEEIIQPSIGKWEQPQSIPVRTKPNRNWVYPTWVTDPIEPVMYPDRWWRPISEPVRVKPNWNWITQGDFKLEEEIVFPILPKWYVPAQQPLFSVKKQQYVYPELSYYAFPIIPLAPIDSWHPLIQAPYFDIKRNQYTYPYFWYDAQQFTQPELITLDKWYQFPSQPLFDVKRLQFSYPNLFYFNTDSLIELITLDKWWVTASEPVRVKENRNWITLGDFRGDRDILIPPFDRWQQPISQPYLIKPNRNWITYGDFKFEPDTIIIPIDRWGQPISQPYFDVKREQYAYSSYFWSIISPIPVNMDMWYARTSEPVRGLRNYFYTNTWFVQNLNILVAVDTTLIVMDLGGCVGIAISPAGDAGRTVILI